MHVYLRLSRTYTHSINSLICTHTCTGPSQKSKPKRSKENKPPTKRTTKSKKTFKRKPKSKKKASKKQKPIDSDDEPLDQIEGRSSLPNIDTKVHWIRSEKEWWMAKVLSCLQSKRDVTVWWMGADDPKELSGQWNLLVDADSRKPIIGRVPFVSVGPAVKFAIGNTLGDNYPVTLPSPPEAAPVSEEESDDGGDDDLEPTNFCSRDFFYDQLDETVSWKKRYDASYQLNLEFGMSRRARKLPMAGGTKAEAEEFWSKFRKGNSQLNLIYKVNKF